MAGKYQRTRERYHQRSSIWTGKPFTGKLPERIQKAGRIALRNYLSLEELEKAHIEKALEFAKGNKKKSRKASKYHQIDYRKLKNKAE